MPKRSRASDVSDEVALSAVASSEPRGNGEGASKRVGGGAKLRFKGSSTSSTAKRQRILTLPAISLEGSMSEEILLRCLSYLNANDLVTVSRVSSAWHRLSQDPQLWRSLYLRTYASASTRRQALSGSPVARSRPWRELYKISTNWRSGTAKSSTLLGQTVRKAVLAEVPNDLALSVGEAAEQESVGLATAPPEGSTRVGNTREATDTILQFYQHYFFTASRSPSTPPDTLPSITVHQSLPTGDSFVLASFSSTRLCDFYSSRPDFRPSLAITELRLDEATARTGHPSHLLLAVFYSTGQFSIFRLTLPSTSVSFFAREVYASLALSSPLSHPFTSSTTRFDPVALARLHSPLLVTCSRSFTLRFLRVVETEGEAIELEEAETPLQSRESWAPVALTLAKSDERGGETKERDWKGKEEGEHKFKVTLAYSTPVFPASWTVGIQEFVIAVPPIPSHKDVAAPLPALARPRLSITARHASATPLHTPLPSTPRRTNVFSPPRISSQSPVTSIEHADPFIVTSRVDNTIDVYEVTSMPLSPSHPRPHSPTTTTTRLHLSTRAPTPTLPSLRIEHRRTLFGHTARVSSVAISTTEGGEQKCISAGDDGAVKVWSLGSGSAASGGAGHKRTREGAITVVARERDEVDLASEWQQMKRRREGGLRGRARRTLDGREGDVEGGAVGDRPERIKRVFVDEDKIVVVGSGRGGGEGERVRVLRFD
ncbi:hypothetical protein JCM5296_000912 [Sporobolomyces johnsonii]